MKAINGVSSGIGVNRQECDKLDVESKGCAGKEKPEVTQKGNDWETTDR